MYLSNFKSSDFLKESLEPYVHQRKETNVLNHLFTDEASRSTICESLINSLITQGKDSITTEFHLKWAMECIGYSLSLPSRRYYSTIISALQIYSKWLFQSIDTPRFVLENLDFYHQEILCHFSLAFYPQKDSIKQSEICGEILLLIKKFIKAEKISNSTWQCLIQLMFIICQKVFNNSRLVDLLHSKVCRTLFEVFLSSGIRDHKLWNGFEEILFKNSEIASIGTYWASTVQGLTCQILSIIMNDPKQYFLYFSGKKPQNDQEDGLHLTFDHEHIIYIWNRILHIFLVDKKSLPNSIESRTAITKGICKTISLFLKVCDKKNLSKEFEAPSELLHSNSDKLNLVMQQWFTSSINYVLGLQRLPVFSIASILDVFGGWLFEENLRLSVVETAKVVEVVCRVFEKAQGPARACDFQRLFSLILECCQRNDPKISFSIIKNFGNTLSSLECVEFVLKTSIIAELAMNHISYETDSMNRRASYTFISEIASLSSLYDLKSLSKQITDIYFIALGAETDEKCFSILIWSICSYLSCCSKEPDILNGLLRGIIDRYGSLDETKSNISYMLLDAISIIPYLINKSDVQIEVVKTNIRNLINFLPRRGKNIEEQIFRIVQCITEWTICFPNIFADEEIKAEVLRIIESKKTEEKFKNFSVYLRQLLMNELNCEEVEGLDWGKGRRGTMYYTEISVFSNLEKENYTDLCIKNHCGTYLWKFKENEYKLKENYRPIMKIEATHARIDCVEPENDKKALLDYEECMDEPQLKTCKRLFDSQKASTSDFTPSSFTFQSPKPSIPHSSAKILKSSLIRRFMAEIGFLDQTSPLILTPLNSIPDKAFSEIDSLSMKKTLIIPILYLATPETKESEIISPNQNHSNSFFTFIKTMGKLLSSPEYCPKALKETLKSFGSCVYKSERILESAVISPALFSPDSKTTLESFLYNKSIAILWNERANDKHTQKVPNLLGKLESLVESIIFLSPISKDLVKVNFFGASPKQGPLLDKMVVSFKVLPKLLVFTVYNLEYNFAGKYYVWKLRVNAVKDCKVKGTKDKISINTLAELFE